MQNAHGEDHNASGTTTSRAASGDAAGVALTLNSGATIPAVGFGTFKLEPSIATASVLAALDVGYRLIDTARMYGNEAEVGEAVRRSGLARDEIFVTSKLWNTSHATNDALADFDNTLADLNIDYLDLFLIHWPVPAADNYVEAWRALEHIVESGRCRSIGVSNFQPAHLDRLAEVSGVVPAVNQIELHPYLSQGDVRAVNADRGIITQAWSPIARGRVLNDQRLVAIGEAAGKTAAQVTLRWHLQRGDIAIPKSSKPESIAENFDIFDFELSARDMAAIDALNQGLRVGPHPDEFNSR